MTLQPTHLQRDVDPATLVQKDQVPGGWVGERTGVAVPSLSNTIELNQYKDNSSKHHDVTDYLLSKVLTPEKLRKPDQMVQVQKNISKLGELLYIIRPLVYGKNAYTDKAEIRIT